MPQRIQEIASAMPGVAVRKHAAAMFCMDTARTISAAWKMLLWAAFSCRRNRARFLLLSTIMIAAISNSWSELLSLRCVTHSADESNGDSHVLELSSKRALLHRITRVAVSL